MLDFVVIFTSQVYMTAHAVHLSRTNATSTEEYTPLNNSHEEADTHIIVHAKQVASM